jgi:hypothetical protein
MRSVIFLDCLKLVGMISRRTKDALATAQRRAVKRGGDRGCRQLKARKKRNAALARATDARAIRRPGDRRATGNRRRIIAGGGPDGTTAGALCFR